MISSSWTKSKKNGWLRVSYFMPRCRPRPASLDLRGLGGRDVALVGHRLEHLVAAIGGVVGIGERVVLRRCLRQAGEQRRLAQAEILDVLVEEDLGGGLHADGRLAEVGAVGGGVQVLVEDVVLGVLGLVLARHLRLLDLALDVVLGIVDVEVADELLGDRRGALADLTGLGVGDGGAEDRAHVDAAVLVEVRVLDRDRPLLQILGDLLQLDRLAEDVGVDVAEAVAGGVEDLRVGAVVGGPQGVDVGRVGGDVEHPDRQAADRDDDQAEQAEENCGDPLADRPARAVASISSAKRHP